MNEVQTCKKTQNRFGIVIFFKLTFNKIVCKPSFNTCLNTLINSKRLSRMIMKVVKAKTYRGSAKLPFLNINNFPSLGSCD